MKLTDSDNIRLLRDVDIVEVNGIEEYVKFYLSHNNIS